MSTNNITVTTKDYFSNASGEGILETKKKEKFVADTSKEKEGDKVKRKDQVNKDGKTRKDVRKEVTQENKNIRKHNRLQKRINWENARIKPGAQKLTIETAPNGKEYFKHRFKALFKKKTADGKTVYTDDTGKVIDPMDVVTSSGSTAGETSAPVYDKSKVDEAIKYGAKIATAPSTQNTAPGGAKSSTTPSGGGGLEAIYDENTAVGVDNSTTGQTDVYQPQDVTDKNGNEVDGDKTSGDKKTIFTTTNIVIALVGTGLIATSLYFIFRKKA